MVRIDKIIYMITCFKSISKDLEPFQYSNPPKNFRFESNSLLVMKRIGVISNRLSNKEANGNLVSHIPLGRERFLQDSIIAHHKDVCHQENPKCLECMMNEKCDYYNRVNDWEIKN